ncbi:MAG: hypothetical protein R8G66_10165 [Cytophagales bacterium]|nr:hypothetical protein [Cytophagales bacterium]
MNERQKGFYAQLGKLSVNFAIMEYKLRVILNYLIGAEDELIAATITENNNLYGTIELIKKVNRIKSFQEERMTELLNRISNIKSDRNFFIHGIWHDPIEIENDISIVCDNRKIKYRELPTIDGTARSWQFNNPKTYKLSFLIELTSNIEDIINTEDQMIEELEKETW